MQWLISAIVKSVEHGERKELAKERDEQIRWENRNSYIFLILRCYDFHLNSTSLERDIVLWFF